MNMAIQKKKEKHVKTIKKTQTNPKKQENYDFNMARGALNIMKTCL